MEEVETITMVQEITSKVSQATITIQEQTVQEIMQVMMGQESLMSQNSSESSSSVDLITRRQKKRSGSISSSGERLLTVSS